MADQESAGSILARKRWGNRVILSAVEAIEARTAELSPDLRSRLAVAISGEITENKEE